MAIIKIILAITSHYYIIIFEISIFIKGGYNYSFGLYTNKKNDGENYYSCIEIVFIDVGGGDGRCYCDPRKK